MIRLAERVAVDPPAAFRAAIGVATLAMLGLSWPLWVGTTDFPRVPFVAGLPAPPGWLSGAIIIALLGAVALWAAGIAARAAASVSFVILVGLILQDQHRFQPWAYQFGIVALAWATVSKANALGLARLFVIALYFHSALSKCDAAFAREMGVRFLEAGLGSLGVNVGGLPGGVRCALILAMPAWELLVSLGLCWRGTRRPALAGAVIMHAALLWILGPFGLRHSAIVLVWNLALIAEVLILFGTGGPAPAPESDGADTAFAPLTRSAFVLAALLPFGERWGLCDSWPGFALYAGHTERTEVVLGGDVARLPAEVRWHLAEVNSVGEGLAYRLDLTGWSREVRGVPVYPQGRACSGLAEALAVRYGAAIRVEVIQWGRADLLTGRRDASRAAGPGPIRRLGDRYRLNAHPARPSA